MPLPQTASRKLAESQLKSAAINARGFSFKSGSKDPREALLSKANRDILLGEISKELREKNLNHEKLTQLASEMILQNQILKKDNLDLNTKISHLIKSIEKYEKSRKLAKYVGCIGKTTNWDKNRAIAKDEYLKMSKGGKKISARQLFDHLMYKFPYSQKADLKEWKEGTIRDWHREFKK
jgi:hypothetical protein